MKVINVMEKMKTGRRKRVHASQRGGGTILNSVARKSYYEKAFDFVSFISFFFFCCFCLFICFCALRFEGDKEVNHVGIGEKHP